MQFLKASLAALAVSAPLASAAKAHVYNKCDVDIYLWSVSADIGPASSPIVLAAGSGSYSETYQVVSQGGVSIKLSNTTHLSGPITQLEYTLDGFIWYDVSNVDCKTVDCPFQRHGMYLSAGDGCPTVSCRGGDMVCTGAYTNPDDNWASLSCQSSADVSLVLCQDSAGGSSNQPASTYQAPAASSTHAQVSIAAVPESTYTPQPTTLATSTTEAQVQVAAVTSAPAAVVASSESAPEVQVVTTIVYVTKTIPWSPDATIPPTYERRDAPIRHVHHPHQRRHE